MVTVKVLVDGFCIGITQYPKGVTFQTLMPAATYMVNNGTGEIVEDKTPVKKKAYKRRDIKAEK